MAKKKRLRPHTHRGMTRRLRSGKKPKVKIVEAKKGRRREGVELRSEEERGVRLRK